MNGEMQLASGELVGRKVVILPHPSYDGDKRQYIGMTAEVVGVKPCGHYELDIEGSYAYVGYYCWDDDMLQPIGYSNVLDEILLPPQTPVEAQKVWYAVVHQDEMGDFSIIGTVSCTDETFSTMEAVLDMMDDINYEVMPLNDAVEMLEV